ncbi:26S proteasome non-ATPase regulatory subunit 4 [Lemmus lemmus]
MARMELDHIWRLPPGPSLTDALIRSLSLASESGAMLGLSASDFKFQVDASADPELAVALRISTEEQRQRQEETWRAVASCEAKGGIGSSWTEDLTMPS